MYPVSDAFHTAVRNGNEQKALLIFSDCVFTDDDISVEAGIQFKDCFNAEEDLAIGQALSNEISFSLFNDARYLNDYTFGDFLATLGVLLGTNSYQERGTAMVVTKFATYVGNATYPFIQRNNVALPSQPSFVVKSIMAYDDLVWCFSDDGRFAVYNDANGTSVSGKKLNNFMKNKVKSWAGKGIYYNKDTRILFIYEGGERKRYEFCPLGYFTAERPKAPDVIQIDLVCYDYMQKFEKDMPSASEMGLSYPTTLGNLYKKMCDYVGVKCKTTTFINSTARISSAPDDFESATMREVLKWIAEAAGSNAKFNRDGALDLVWLTDTAQSYAATNYSEFNPYWYETKKVTKLRNRDTNGNTDKTLGSGSEEYLIQDNPFLRGVR